MSDSEVKSELLEAAKAHVPFDGWSEASFRAAIEETGVEPGLARAIYPRGAIDLALAYHEAGDQTMLARLKAQDLSEIRFRDRVAAAVRYRLEAIEDRELVRRGTTLFTLPHHALDGAQAVWRTCDLIWASLGDSSQDMNWYTKRATLAGVYSATLLYWLGDDSPEHEATWEFLDRRIDDVMQIEKFKAKARENKLVSGLMGGPLGFLARIRPPQGTQQSGMPGRWSDPS